MFLIYVMAKTFSPNTLTKKEVEQLPEHDLKPVMVSLSRKAGEYVIREHDSKDEKGSNKKDLDDIPRVYAKLHEQKEEEEPSDIDVDTSMSENNTQLAVALATIILKPNQIKPTDDKFVSYIVDRAKLADKIVIAGYTGDTLSMAKSEELSMKRARTVREMIAKRGLKTDLITISRPKCNYADNMRFSHRVEVIGLFASGEPDDGEPVTKKNKKKEQITSNLMMDSSLSELPCSKEIH